MTVSELISELENYDEDMEVCIGMYQTYGSNWTYDICEVEVNGKYSMYGEDEDEVVMLIMGRQDGTIIKEADI